MKKFIEEVVVRNNFQSVRLLDILREVQARFRYISKETIEILADLLSIERTQIISVIEFSVRVISKLFIRYSAWCKWC